MHMYHLHHAMLLSVCLRPPHTARAHPRVACRIARQSSRLAHSRLTCLSACTGLASLPVSGLTSHFVPLKLFFSTAFPAVRSVAGFPSVCVIFSPPLSLHLDLRIRRTDSWCIPNFFAKKNLSYCFGSIAWSSRSPAMAAYVNFFVGDHPPGCSGISNCRTAGVDVI